MQRRHNLEKLKDKKKENHEHRVSDAFEDV